MQSFMMGVVMGTPPPKHKELREHQKGQAELRGISRKLAHVAGTYARPAVDEFLVRCGCVLD